MEPPQTDAARWEALYRGVGQRVRDARVARGVTQEWLAKRIGFKRTSITNVESGTQKLLVHTLVEIARALEVEAGALLPGSEESPDERPAEAPKMAEAPALAKMTRVEQGFVVGGVRRLGARARARARQ